MRYKGCAGSVKFSKKDNLFYGKIINVNGLAAYEGKTMRELVEDFHSAVDDYLELYKMNGLKP